MEVFVTTLVIMHINTWCNWCSSSCHDVDSFEEMESTAGIRRYTRSTRRTLCLCDQRQVLGVRRFWRRSK